MTRNIPSDYVKSFTNERLTIIATALLEQCYETEDDLRSNYDDGYTSGCTRFGRQRNRLLEMPKEHDWLTTLDSSNKLTMAIEGAPFRFTTDDYLFPKKKKVLEISEQESAQLANGGFQCQLNLTDPNSDLTLPVKWRFYIDVTKNIEDGSRDYEISFIGQNIINEPCCVWKLSEHKSSYISSIDDIKPEPVKINKPKTTLPNTTPDKQNKDVDKK